MCVDCYVSFEPVSDAEKFWGRLLRWWKASSAHTIAMTNERVPVTTKHEKLRSKLKQRVGFANKEVVCLEKGIVSVTFEQEASVARAVQLLVDAQYSFGSVEDA